MRTTSSLVPPGSDHLALPSHPNDFLFLPGNAAGPPCLYCPPFRGKKSPSADTRLPSSIPLRLRAVPASSPSSSSPPCPGHVSVFGELLRRVCDLSGHNHGLGELQGALPAVEATKAGWISGCWSAAQKVSYNLVGLLFVTRQKLGA
jgi:hypothetical protein